MQIWAHPAWAGFLVGLMVVFWVGSKSGGDVLTFPFMGLLKHKTEGGSGGKRGHSNMDHWIYTDEIKTATRKRRRLEAKETVREVLNEPVRPSIKS